MTRGSAKSLIATNPLVRRLVLERAEDQYHRNDWKKAKCLSNLASHNRRPPFGLRARLLRDNRIDYRTGDYAFDSAFS